MAEPKGGIDLSRWLSPDESGRLVNLEWLREVAVDESASNEECLKSTAPLLAYSKLRKLSLQQHFIPDLTGLSAFQELRELSVTDCNVNELGRDFPTDRLLTLDLSGNSLVDVEELADAPLLTQLGLSRNPLRQLAPRINWPNLLSLGVSGVPSNLNWEELAGLPSLKVLYVKQTPLPDLHVLATIPNLSELYGTLEGGRSSLDFSELTSLKKLHLHVKNAENLRNFRCGAALKEICLTHGAKLTDVSALANCSSLTSLELNYCAVSDFSFLAYMQRLERLSLKGSAESTVWELRKRFPQLEISS